MEKAEESVASEWMNVINDLQHRIVAGHNASSTNNSRNERVSVNDLRLAAQRHPEIAFWVKYNRARQGTLQAGDVAPNVAMIRAKDDSATTLLATTSFHECNNHNKPIVCFAGSLS